MIQEWQDGSTGPEISVTRKNKHYEITIKGTYGQIYEHFVNDKESIIFYLNDYVKSIQNKTKRRTK